jgi:hypothetical protein
VSEAGELIADRRLALPDWARSRRKRNVDGGVPPVRDQMSVISDQKITATAALVVLSAGKERNLITRFLISGSWHP